MTPRSGPVDPIPEPRRIDLEQVGSTFKPHKITYTFTVEEINRMIANQLGYTVTALDFGWNIEERHDASNYAQTVASFR